MEIPKLEQLIQTTRVPPRKVSSNAVSVMLENGGWKREIAGEADFNRAVNAIKMFYEHGRGLFITGQAGVGKSLLMRCLQRVVSPRTLNWMYCKNEDDINYMRSRNEDNIKGNVFIDDIGCEEVIKEYGNTVDVVGDYIQRFHYRGNGRLFATTNLNSEEINNKYGTRVLDRILEMCVVLKLEGKSKRERIIVA